MTDKEYIEKAVRTAAPTSKFANRFDNGRETALKNVLYEFISSSKQLDVYKKNMIYGKENPDIEEKIVFPIVSYSEKELNLIHGILGIATEAGEIAEIYSKDLRNLDLVNLKEEIGDLLWYIALICDTFKFDLGEIKGRNIEKLAARYPNLFTEKDAVNRNLETERDILEK